MKIFIIFSITLTASLSLFAQTNILGSGQTSTFWSPNSNGATSVGLNIYPEPTPLLNQSTVNGLSWFTFANQNEGLRSLPRLDGGTAGAAVGDGIQGSTGIGDGPQNLDEIFK